MNRRDGESFLLTGVTDGCKSMDMDGKDTTTASKTPSVRAFRALLAERGLTSADVARMCGITRQGVWHAIRYESPAKTLERILAAAGIDPSEMVRRVKACKAKGRVE